MDFVFKNMNFQKILPLYMLISKQPNFPNIFKKNLQKNFIYNFEIQNTIYVQVLNGEIVWDFQSHSEMMDTQIPLIWELAIHIN